MKKTGVYFCAINLLCLSVNSVATAGKAEMPSSDGVDHLKDLPSEMRIEQISSFLDNQGLGRLGRVNHFCQEESQDYWKLKVAKLEALMELDQFIQLPNSQDAISHIGVTQKLWVEVMGNNPSFFYEKRFCPELGAHEVVEINGKLIEMCRDLPVEQVIGADLKTKDSDVELIEKLNKIYERAGLDTRFRAHKSEEYDWADTEGGQKPKRLNDPDLWKAATYWDISNNDPKDLTKPSSSGYHQTHPVKAKQPNTFGFYRNSVWEWAANWDLSHRRLVGNAWGFGREYAQSGASYWVMAHYTTLSKKNVYGPARLIRTKIPAQMTDVD